MTALGASRVHGFQPTDRRSGNQWKARTISAKWKTEFQTAKQNDPKRAIESIDLECSQVQSDIYCRNHSCAALPSVVWWWVLGCLTAPPPPWCGVVWCGGGLWVSGVVFKPLPPSLWCGGGCWV